MATRVFDDLSQLRAAIGQPLGASDWVTVDQNLIDGFAELTGADHWSHVDRERSAAGPFGATIAQGMLVLSLGPPLSRRIFSVEGYPQVLNYGFEKVRFTAPVVVGARVRVVPTVLDVEVTDAGGRVTTKLVFEVDGETKPACVAEMLSHFAR